SGRTFSVCPGTSSWQSIAGRTHNMIANVRSAARHGKAGGASGYLITDWGDRGHLQPLCVSYPGILAGAAHAWNARRGPVTDGARAAGLARPASRGDAGVLGGVMTRLGDVYRTTGATSTNGSALFFLLAFADEPLPHARMRGLRATELHSTRERIQELKS